MKAEQLLMNFVGETLENLFPGKALQSQIQLQKTRKEFEGDLTLVLFPIIKPLGKKPEELGEIIGAKLQADYKEIAAFNVVKGFLNISLSDRFWINTLPEASKPDFGFHRKSGKTYLVEYSSPNTNKPLHLGHLRNNFLGYSVSEILKANGHDVIKTQIINDRGIHICKSMLAWQLAGLNETPENTGMKGDKLVGKYYVEFDKALREELKPILNSIYAGEKNNLFSGEEQQKLGTHVAKINQLNTLLQEKKLQITAAGFNLFDEETVEAAQETIAEKSSWKDLGRRLEKFEKPSSDQKILIKAVKELSQLEGKIIDEQGEIKEIAQNKTRLMQQAQKMLRDWENGDEATIALWKKMNGWVYEGFNTTYKNIGVDFDKLYYESNTYILGKDIVQEGLQKGVFFQKEDGSVWIDLTADGLDEKLLLRGDGTSVYITQDIGTAILRYKDFPKVNGMIYTVGNEQDYHFKVLFLILKKLGYAFADECFHLSYGMVDLPSGKMKSREGTVVDADDLAKEVISDLEKATIELGKVDDVPAEDRPQLYETLGLGALKYFILKVDPKKRMLFNPAESIDIQGNTGPFLQYAYARIQSLLRKAGDWNPELKVETEILEPEKLLLQQINEFPAIIAEAGKAYSPALVANYIYDLVKSYNHFYQSVIILKEADADKRNFRLLLSKTTGNIIENGLKLLGIGVPERM